MCFYFAFSYFPLLSLSLCPFFKLYFSLSISARSSPAPTQLNLIRCRSKDCEVNCVCHSIFTVNMNVLTLLRDFNTKYLQWEYFSHFAFHFFRVRQCPHRLHFLFPMSVVQCFCFSLLSRDERYSLWNVIILRIELFFSVFFATSFGFVQPYLLQCYDDDDDSQCRFLTLFRHAFVLLKYHNIIFYLILVSSLEEFFFSRVWMWFQHRRAIISHFGVTIISPSALATADIIQNVSLLLLRVEGIHKHFYSTVKDSQQR